MSVDGRADAYNPPREHNRQCTVQLWNTSPGPYVSEDDVSLVSWERVSPAVEAGFTSKGVMELATFMRIQVIRINVMAAGIGKNAVNASIRTKLI